MKITFNILFLLMGLSVFAGSSPAADRAQSKTSPTEIITTERGPSIELERCLDRHVEIEGTESVLTKSPQPKRGEVKTLATLAILFNSLGVISLILALVFIFSSIVAWPFFVAGIIFLILGSVFWAMARQARRENQRERNRNRRRRRR